MASTSDQVRALYDQFPYPQRDPGTSLDPYVDFVLNLSAEPRGPSPTFLDAGCGTGSCVLGAALLHKNLQVYGCDFSSAGLETIRSDMRELNLSNITLGQFDLLEFPEDFGPEEGFDVIFCTGVIHHTQNPSKILKSLAGRLAPQGVLRLMVYAKRGREELYRFSQIVDELFGDRESIDERLMGAKSLLAELHQCGEQQGVFPPALRGPLADSNTIGIEEFADRYLHPHDAPYTLTLLKEEIEKSGLRFHRWFDRREWDLKELLPEFMASGDAPDDPWEQYEMVEELFDRDQYDCYLVGPDFKPNTAPLTWSSLLRLNPQVHLTETSFRGYGIDYEAKLLLHAPEPLTYEQGQIAKAVAREPKTLSAVVEELGREQNDLWFQAAQELFQREYLYRPTGKQKL